MIIIMSMPICHMGDMACLQKALILASLALILMFIHRRKKNNLKVFMILIYLVLLYNINQF